MRARASTKRVAGCMKTALDEELADQLEKELPDEGENDLDEDLDGVTPPLERRRNLEQCSMVGRLKPAATTDLP